MPRLASDNKQLAIAPTMAYDLLHNPVLFDALWHHAAQVDPRTAWQY